MARKLTRGLDHHNVQVREPEFTLLDEIARGANIPKTEVIAFVIRQYVQHSETTFAAGERLAREARS